MPRPTGRLDRREPVNWDHPLNAGLVADWTITPLSGWSRGSYLRNLVRGAHAPNDGTFSGGAQWGGPKGRPGGFGRVGRSANASDTMSVSTASLPSMTDCTISFWFYYSPVAFYRVFAPLFPNTGGSRLFGFEPSADGSGNLTARFDVGFSQYSGSAIPANTWQHLALVRSGSTALIYQNAVQTLSQSAVDTTATAGTFAIALDDGATSHPQTIQYSDAVQVYKRGLSASEVLALYLETRRGNPERFRWLRPVTFGVSAAPAGGASQNLLLLGVG